MEVEEIEGGLEERLYNPLRGRSTANNDTSVRNYLDNL